MVGDRVAERYELEELVGSGGMSSVYRAQDSLLERTVALKILHPQYAADGEYVQRFRHEARAVAQLSHPNIVTVIDRGEDEGRQFIVFEYVEGENLKELITRTGPLPIRRAVELGLGMARALAFAHEHGLVHRDVKPQNVLLNGTGEAKVTDFGIARSIDVERGLTQTGTVLGTSNYLAPEQATGKPVGPATDVYSLGIVLYELLTAEIPFEGDNFVSVAMKHVHEPLPSLVERRPDAPLRLVHAIERATAKDPADRFPTMAALADELEACLADLNASDGGVTQIVPSPVVRASARRRIRTGRRRLPLYLSLLVVAGAAAVLAGVIALGGSSDHAKKNAGASRPPASARVHLSGVGAYDPPPGDGTEHAEVAGRATDGNAATYWYTQTYRSFTKPGVGLVLDAGRIVRVARLTIASDTANFSAQVRVSDAPTGGFRPDSRWRQVGPQTTFALEGKRGRYYLVWVRLPRTGGVAHVNEVTATS
jgi:serine/threonine protein kinase